MHHNSLLGIGGKPVIAWQPGCGRDPTYVSRCHSVRAHNQCNAFYWCCLGSRFVQCPPKELWDWPSYDKMTPENAQAAQQRLFMRLLYYGNQPALPFPRNVRLRDLLSIVPLFSHKLICCVQCQIGGDTARWRHKHVHFCNCAYVSRMCRITPSHHGLPSSKA